MKLIIIFCLFSISILLTIIFCFKFLFSKSDDLLDGFGRYAFFAILSEILFFVFLFCK